MKNIEREKTSFHAFYRPKTCFLTKISLRSTEKSSFLTAFSLKIEAILGGGSYWLPTRANENVMDREVWGEESTLKSVQR